MDIKEEMIITGLKEVTCKRGKGARHLHRNRIRLAEIKIVDDED